MPKLINRHTSRLTVHDTEGKAYNLAPGQAFTVDGVFDVNHPFVKAGMIHIKEKEAKARKDIREEYFELFGKKAGNKKEATIQAEIDEFKAAS